MKAFYFGCWRSGSMGHHYHYPGGRAAGREAKELTPWGYSIDSSKSHAPEGRIRKLDGWTAIGFDDRSVDNRGKSHSTFIFDQDLTYGQALAVAKEHFPEIIKRLEEWRGKALPL